MPTSKHGTRYGYAYYGCKCEACRKANSDYSGTYRRTEHPNHIPRHGTTSEYANHGCRCRDCKTEWARSCREYQWRRKGVMA